MRSSRACAKPPRSSEADAPSPLRESLRTFFPSRRRLLGAASASGALLAIGCKPSEPVPEVSRPGAASTDGKAPAAVSTAGSLRLDLRHSVTGGVDAFQLVRVRAEPHWPGRTSRPGDALGWGDYRLSALDPADGAPLFRTGFDSPAGASAASAATGLSVRLPVPRRPVRIVIEKRRAGSVFQTAWEVALDPSDRAIDRSSPSPSPRVDAVFIHGAAPTKADIAILGEGYRSAEYAKFLADAKRAAGYLFSVEPFAARMRDFNVHAVFTPSAESGATDAYLGIRRDTAFGATYGSGIAERTLAVTDNHALYEAAAAVPYDFLLVLVNARRYGGSAFFGGPAAVAIDNAAARYLVLHEFAHVIGGLADEYYVPAGEGPMYRGNVEPWHPNVTLSAAGAKWQAPGARGSVAPATWNKREYDKYFAGYVKRYERLRASNVDEAVVEKFMATESARQAALLAKNTASRRVGAFEGANGYATGMFRSEADCIMFSLQTDYFCHACTYAIEQMIAEHAG